MNAPDLLGTILPCLHADPNRCVELAASILIPFRLPDHAVETGDGGLHRRQKVDREAGRSQSPAEVLGQSLCNRFVRESAN